MTDIESQQDYYDDIGFSERLGFGQQPAVLVIDMCRGITEPGKMFIDMEEHIPHINAINEAARRIGAPVIFTTVAYHKDYSDAGTFGLKVPLLRDLHIGSEASEIDPRVPVLEEDHLIPRNFQRLLRHQSAIAADRPWRRHHHHRRQLHQRLRTCHCVRAVSGGFKPIVPSDCVADRAPLSHKVNLFDMDSKYADVMPSADVLDYLNGLAAGRAAAEVTIRYRPSRFRCGNAALPSRR